MAEDDIYGNKRKYERFKDNLKTFSVPPSNSGQRTYYCKNPVNLKYFKTLFLHFEANDLSFIRRNRIIHSFKFIVFSTPKDLGKCTRDDINKIMALMHIKNKSPESKRTFIKDLKYIWKNLFPEIDEKGRADETIVPYVVRHVTGKIDISKNKLRKDNPTWDEFEKLLDYFSSDPRIQAYLTLSQESLVRPQELLYRRIGEIQHYKWYAKILLSDHGKEGPGFLQCIDSYPYLLKWLNVHPQKNDSQAFIFVNTGNTNSLRQLKPGNINKMLRKACKDLKISKHITCYSLKRSGVTIRRLRGESDVEIQHVARWTSTKQLKTYDQSSQEDVFKMALQKRGMIPNDTLMAEIPESKTCAFCNEKAGYAETSCPKCKHPFDRSLILNEKKKDEELLFLRKVVLDFNHQFGEIKQEILKELSVQILEVMNTRR
jgi:hypothetical protein